MSTDVEKRQEQADEDAYVIEQLGTLLARIAVAVKGPDGELTRHSYHDIPDRVESILAEVIALRAELAAKDAAVAELSPLVDRMYFAAWDDNGGFVNKATCPVRFNEAYEELCATLANYRGAK